MVSFVYLDIGGVMVVDFNTDSRKWTGFERHLGVRPRDFDRFESFWHGYDNEVNTGRELATLIPAINKAFGCGIPADYPLLDEFIGRFTPNRAIWPMVREIAKRYKMGLITNAGPHMLDRIRSQGVLPRLRWDAVVDSSVEKVLKPDYRIYRIAEARSGFKGGEVAFVDNSEENVRAARRIGWKAFLYDSSAPKRANAALMEWMAAQGSV